MNRNLKRPFLAGILGVLAVVTAAFLARPDGVAAGGGAANVERRIVTTDLVVPPGEIVESPAIALDGFAIWSVQVSIRSGNAMGLAWRLVDRMRADLGWVPGGAGFGTSAIGSDLVRAPFGAVQFRNLGGEPVTVAVSAYLGRRDNFERGSRIASTSVIVRDAVTVPPGQFRFSAPVDLGDATRITTQLFVPAGVSPQPGLVVAAYEAKIFDPQAFVFVNGGNAADDFLGNPVAVHFAQCRMKITNSSPNPVDVVVAHYLVSEE